MASFIYHTISFAETELKPNWQYYTEVENDNKTPTTFTFPSIMILNKRLQQNADPWWQCVKLGDISTRKLHYTVYSNQSRARNILYCSVLNKNWPLGVIFLLCTTVKRSNRSVGLRPLLFPRYLRIQYKNIKKLSNSLYNCRCILKEGVSRGYASKGPWLTGFREMKNSRLTQCGHLPR